MGISVSSSSSISIITGFFLILLGGASAFKFKVKGSGLSGETTVNLFLISDFFINLGLLIERLSDSSEEELSFDLEGFFDGIDVEGKVEAKPRVAGLASSFPELLDLGGINTGIYFLLGLLAL